MHRFFYQKRARKKKGIALFELIGKEENNDLRKNIKKGAAKKGLIFIKDTSGTNIDVQIIDTDKIDFNKTNYNITHSKKEKPVIIVMDYAFGEQAYETLDELLKPYRETGEENQHLNVVLFQ